MDIKKYRPEQHEEYLPDYMKSTFGKGDIEKFKPVVREALRELKQTVDFSDGHIDLVIARTDEENMQDNAPKDYYFMGFSFDDGMRGHEGNAVFLRASDDVDNWREALKSMLVHELGHQIFYQAEVDWEDDQYHSLMFEGHAMNLSRIVGEENNWNYSPVWRTEESIDLDTEVLSQDLEQPRTFGDEDDEVDHNMFVKAGQRWQDAEGYMIAFQIVKHLMEEDRISIETMIEKPSGEWKEMVREAIEEIY